MAVALTVHLPQGFFWNEGGYEYPLMWGILALAIFLRGGGAYSLDARFGLRI
jgi:putative oxidoreductase